MGLEQTKTRDENAERNLTLAIFQTRRNVFFQQLPLSQVEFEPGTKKGNVPSGKLT